MNKTARTVINYCINNHIGTLIVGYNETFQRNSHIGKPNNQNFVNIPYGRLRNKLEYLCELNDIAFIKQEESYTSKASFFDKDLIPIYNADNPKEYQFSGKKNSSWSLQNCEWKSIQRRCKWSIKYYA